MQIYSILLYLQDRLIPKYNIRDLEIWRQCYFRWIPMLEIKNGGFPQVDLYNRMLLNDIRRLQKCLQEQSIGYNCNNRMSTNYLLNHTSPSNTMETDEQSTNRIQININSFFPFTSNTGNSADLTDILTTNGGVMADGSIYDTTSLAHQYID